MEKFYTLIGAGLTAIIIISLASIITGTILWAIWDVIYIFFGKTFLPENPTWWQCVKVSWLLSIIARIIIPNIEIKSKQ